MKAAGQAGRERGGWIDRADLRAGLAILVASAAVELCAWGAVLAWTGRHDQALLTGLAVGVLWAAMAGPVLAAGGAGPLGALARGGLVADGLGVALAVIAAASSDLTLLDAAKAYVVCLGMCLTGVCAAGLAPRPLGRAVAGVVTAVALLAALAGPFWVGGLLASVGGRGAERLAAAAVWANPFYSASAALSQRMGFAWHLSPRLYELTRLGTDVPVAPAHWYGAAVVYFALAGLLGVAGALFRRRGPAGRASGPPGGAPPGRDG